MRIISKRCCDKIQICNVSVILGSAGELLSRDCMSKSTNDASTIQTYLFFPDGHIIGTYLGSLTRVR